LWLSRLTVTDFRCYARAEIEADGRPVVLAGPNGAGKTNLLEAISYLAPGRGLRQARLSDVARRAAPDATPLTGFPGPPGPWAVAATVATPDGPRDLGTGRDPAIGAQGDGGGNGGGNGAGGHGETGRPRERRVVRIDGAPARSQQELGEILAIVWLSPRMDGLFRDSGSARRRFLDRLVYGFDPAHAGRVAAYEQALRARARLLKQGGAEDAWLTALEDTMARHGIAIAAARRDLVGRLTQASGAANGTASGTANGAGQGAGRGAFPVAGLALDGDIEAALEGQAALAVEDGLRARLAESRPRDAATGGAAVGPHRSDLAVSHRERGLPAALCSTGEQKALLISIVLAHARLLALHRDSAPLLLLDEIAAHLDEERRHALFDEILELGVQAWLTGTDATVFADLGERAQFIHVRAAVLTPVAPPTAPPAAPPAASPARNPA
jgi:DNA replication and repair protein RecF